MNLFLVPALLLCEPGAAGTHLKKEWEPPPLGRIICACTVSLAKSRHAVVGDESGNVYAIDLDSKKIEKTRHKHRGAVTSVAFEKQSGLLSLDEDHELIYSKLDGTNPTSIHNAIGRGSGAVVGVSCKGELVVGSSDRCVKLVRANDVRNPSVLGRTNDWISALDISPGGDVVVAGDYANLYFWSTSPGKLNKVVKEKDVLSLRVIGKDTSVAGCHDGGIALYDAKGGLIRRRNISSAPLSALDVADDGKTILAADSAGLVRVVSIELRELHKVQAHNAPISGIRYLPEDRRVVTCSWDGRVILWRLSSSTARL